MASPSTENAPRGGSTRGSSRGGRGGSGGRGRGGRGRGRGGSRTSSVDLASPTTPTTTDSTNTKDDKPPSLLSRINMGDAIPTVRSPKVNQPASPRSPATPQSGGDGASPRGGGNSRGSRRRKNSATSTSSRSATVTNISSPLSRRPPISNSPLPSATSSPKMTPPHLVNVTDTASPKQSPSPIHQELEPAQVVEIKASSAHPSPAPSPRPFTPMTRDWAAEDDDEDGGSLPSLDDWGLPGIKPMSEAGDVNAQEQPSITDSMSKLSLKTDVKKTRGKRSGSAQSSDSPGASNIGNVIPPTPVITRPGQTQQPNNTALRPSPLHQSTLGVPNTARPTSRSSSPAPLNLPNDNWRSPLPSPGLSPGLKPTSGGVALGVRSRPVSPAPDMGQFYPQASSSPRPGGNFNLAPSPNAATTEFIRSRPTSPSLHAPYNPDLSQAGSRPGSPSGRPKGLSGGVSLGLGASDGGNSPLPSPGPGDRFKDINLAPSWRSTTPQPNPPVLLESPIPPSGPFPLPPKPNAQQYENRGGNPNWRGRGTAPRGGRGGRGGYRGGNDGYRNQPYNSSPSDDYNSRSAVQGDSPGPNGVDSSPRSVASDTSTGRGRGHTRNHSRPKIVAGSAMISRIQATLASPPQRPAKSNNTSDSVSVTGA